MRIFKKLPVLISAAPLSLLPASSFAAEAQVDSANTAWILTATALVLFMTVPGLSLFYAGLVRSKNVLSVLMQCFSIAALVSIIWLLVGYSISFGPAESGFWGGLDKAFLNGVTQSSVWGEQGWLFKMGLIDYAEGTVVHVTAGVAALVTAVMLGARKGFLLTPMMPHNLTMTFIGAGMLWVGWFGFNAGSALAANGNAGMALLVTHISASAGALTWMSIEWVRHGKPSGLGAVTGLVAGLATITPASGSVAPLAHYYSA